MKRRDLFTVPAAALALQAQTGTTSPDTKDADARGLPLERYQPTSTLVVPETKVSRCRFPLIDFHTHLTFSAGLSGPEKVAYRGTPEECLAVMDRKNIQTLVNLTGGYGPTLKEVIGTFQQSHPGRFLVFTEPAWRKVAEPGYAKFQAGEIENAAKVGAKGIKVLKTLGLYVRENVTTGKLLRVDDPRFDPMWETAGSLGLPIAIHTSDPAAFFLPIDRFNERWEELHAHANWSFHGKDFPSDRELQEARRNVMRRHPGTQFVCLHVATAENLPYVSECLDAHPNMHVEIGARIGELGRQPRAARKFFDKYQDRILFGTDAVPKGYETPQQIFGERLYEIYFRFLETEDEYFDYAPAAIPPQGRWRISGIGLPEQILEKVYRGNAERLLKLQRLSRRSSESAA